jgi:hypothetical protein
MKSMFNQILHSLGHHTWSKWETTHEGYVKNSRTKGIVGTIKIQERSCLICNKKEQNRIEIFIGY